MNILVLNCGSSSIKYSFFNSKAKEPLVMGAVEKIGEESSIIFHQRGDHVITDTIRVMSHRQGLEYVMRILQDPSKGVIKNLSEISAVGHRVVHGGSDFVESTIINDENVKYIQKYAALAPLHNPPNLVGIEVSRNLLPGIPHVAVFDTAFHQTIPEVSYTYAIPYGLSQKHGIRRYGFHGTSHRYVCQRAAEVLGTRLETLRMITCHLGNGCSIAAIDRGNSVDTSMGFTPLEGLPMGTRCGDIDPSIVFFIAKNEKLDVTEIDDLLNKKSGLLGLSGMSNDLRAIRAEANLGNPRAKLTLDVLAYRIKKYIGAYSAVLGGVEVVVFTGGIGENAPYVRQESCRGLEFLGLLLDDDRNNDPLEYQGVINAENSGVKVLVVPTREDLIIARETSEAVVQV